MSKTIIWTENKTDGGGRHISLIRYKGSQHDSKGYMKILLLYNISRMYYAGSIRRIGNKADIRNSVRKSGRRYSSFLSYTATHLNASIQYYASGMVLHVDSDASDLSVSKERSRVRGHHYLSSPSENIKKPPVTPPPPNGPLHAVCSIMNNFMASAVEAEMGGLFVNE